MLEKLSGWMTKVEQNMRYSRCYTDMEKIGVACMGLCSGDKFSNECKKCPHYTFIPNIGRALKK